MLRSARAAVVRGTALAGVVTALIYRLARAIYRLVPIAIVALAVGVFFMLPSSPHGRRDPTDPRPTAPSGVVVSSTSGTSVGEVSLDDAAVPAAPGVVTWAKAHPLEAVLIAVIIVFAIIDFVALTLARRPGPPSDKQRMRAGDKG